MSRETLRQTFFAHSANRGGRREPTVEHIRPVTQRTASFASVFGAETEGYVAGLLHDLGKYSEKFDARLRDEESGVDHWTVGGEAAVLLYARTPEHAAKANVDAVQAVIRGHHLGLAAPTYHGHTGHDARSKSLVALPALASMLGVPGERPQDVLLKRLLDDGFTPPPSLLLKGDGRYEYAKAVAGMLDVRMLFSCLVDADYLETEAHFRGDAAVPRRPRVDGPPLNAAVAMACVEQHTAGLAVDNRNAKSDVLALRGTLLDDCIVAASGERGRYTLTAPTGAGKTMAMLAFALTHAQKHQMRRVVSVIPFLTIIEQTAMHYRAVFAEVFSDEFVLEDHSQAGNRSYNEEKSNSDAEARRHAAREIRLRLLAENYDAPLVLCTSVQLLESLFAHRPRPCRKLHRLANSVLLFDEVQTLPPELAVPTLAAVSRLVERYGCTAVFATATQPAFDHLHKGVLPQCKAGWRPREIVRDAASMFKIASRRTRVDWRLDGPTPWWSIAHDMAKTQTGLCVVNLKRHARRLVELLQSDRAINRDSLFHLSTSLCPLHRQRVLKDVKDRLDAMQACLLVSTQCIEAGVDISFTNPPAGGPPRGWRALAPLEAIAQTAGRINRGGESDVPGIVTVFEPEQADDERTLYPPGYGEAAAFCRLFVTKCLARGEDVASLIHDPDHLKRYFRQFYDLTGKAKPGRTLMQAIAEWDFETVSRLYKLISQNTARVLVPYDHSIYSRLRDEAVHGVEPERARAWFAAAAPLGVNVARRTLLDSNASAVLPVAIGHEPADGETAEWFVLEDSKLYDSERLGLLSVASDVLMV